MRGFDVFLLDLAKVTKAIAFYPVGHPTLATALTKIAQELDEYAQSGNVVLEVKKESISLRGSTVAPANPVMRDFMQALLLRRVTKIVFSPGVDQTELGEFLKLINMEVGALFAAGGLEALIEAGPIRNIALSEVQLDRLLTKQPRTAEPDKMDENEQKAAEFADTFMQTVDFEGEISPAETGADRQQTELESAAAKWERLRQELEEAKSTADDGKYTATIREIGGLIGGLEWAVAADLVTDVLAFLVDETGDPVATGGMRREATRFVTDELHDERLGVLLDIMIGRGDDSEFLCRIRAVFMFLGERPIEVMLERLITSNDLKARRTIISEVAALGDRAFERVLFHLGDERWYVVRNMVVILGIFGRAEALDRLFEAARHRDQRVKKEVVKTLVRIQSPRSFAFLREMLQSETDDVRQLIVFSLGIMKNRGAIADIERLIRSDVNLAIRREGLIALGRIGDPSALPMLREFATKKGFFSKNENKVLRLAAISGLAEIRTDETRGLLEKLVKESDHDIRDAAFEALQKIKHL